MKPYLVSLVVALAIAGCGDSAAPFFNKGSITASIVPSSVRSGDTATVAVSIVNRTPLPLRVGGSACPFSFVIQNSAGNAVGRSPDVFCVAVLVSVTIAPGDSVAQRFSWVAATADGVRLLPGQYRVEGRCDWAKGEASVPQPFVVTP